MYPGGNFMKVEEQDFGSIRLLFWPVILKMILETLRYLPFGVFLGDSFIFHIEVHIFYKKTTMLPEPQFS